MILKIYSEQKYLPDRAPHIHMLVPFWGIENALDAVSNDFEIYQALGDNLFAMTSLAEADFVVLPADWQFYQGYLDLAKSLVEVAAKFAKKTIVFHWSDRVDPNLDPNLDLGNIILFHTSLNKSQQRTDKNAGNKINTIKDFALPFWGEDIASKLSEVPILEKSAIPTIGFCGFVSKLPLKSVVKTYLKQIGTRLGFNSPPAMDGAKTRNLALHNLSKFSQKFPQQLTTNFITRDRFYGGALAEDGRWDFEIVQKVRREYFENILRNNYTLCVRGLGNYSQRFYDVLCCGKIPIFVNTDCVLPYDFAISWKKYCVWVEADELSKIPAKVIEFHTRISDRDFVRMQYECRKLWKEWLSIEGFFTNLHRHFD